MNKKSVKTYFYNPLELLQFVDGVDFTSPLEVLDEQSIVAGYKGKTPISVPIDNQLTLTVNQFENMCRYPNKSYSQLKGKIYSLINLNQLQSYSFKFI